MDLPSGGSGLVLMRRAPPSRIHAGGHYTLYRGPIIDYRTTHPPQTGKTWPTKQSAAALHR